MQYPSTIEPNFYAYYNGSVIYAISDTNEQYDCGNKANVTKDNCPYILVTLNTKKNRTGESKDIRLYLDYLISIGDKYSKNENSDRILPCIEDSYLDVLVDLQKRDITEMLLQGYSKEYIEGVIPYYLKTTPEDLESVDGVFVGGYSPYVYLQACSYHKHKDSGTVVNLIDNTPINLDDDTLWKDIALSEAQKTADRILALADVESEELIWATNNNSSSDSNPNSDPNAGGGTASDNSGGIIDNPGTTNPFDPHTGTDTPVDSSDDIIDDPEMGEPRD